MKENILQNIPVYSFQKQIVSLSFLTFFSLKILFVCVICIVCACNVCGVLGYSVCIHPCSCVCVCVCVCARARVLHVMCECSICVRVHLCRHTVHTQRLANVLLPRDALSLTEPTAGLEVSKLQRSSALSPTPTDNITGLQAHPTTPGVYRLETMSFCLPGSDLFSLFWDCCFVSLFVCLFVCLLFRQILSPN